MYAVFGKSLSIERKKTKKNTIVSEETALEEFNKNTSIYRVSPDYASIDLCYEFLKLAAKYKNEVRCLYIAKLQNAVDKSGTVKIKVNKKSIRIEKKYFPYITELPDYNNNKG